MYIFLKPLLLFSFSFSVSFSGLYAFGLLLCPILSSPSSSSLLESFFSSLLLLVLKVNNPEPNNEESFFIKLSDELPNKLTGVFIGLDKSPNAPPFSKFGDFPNKEPLFSEFVPNKPSVLKPVSFSGLLNIDLTGLSLSSEEEELLFSDSSFSSLFLFEEFSSSSS